ncbi:carbohydrate binding domain-containing protein, partial [candidate division KSB1 bacterium]|nr:carbohydrate binding domain-containing protein [candidate division KSB1 bacterium]
AISINNGGTNSWDVHLGQDNLVIENGMQYEVSFDAYASSPRTIYALVGMNSDPWTVYHDAQNFSLTTEKQRFTYSFTMTNLTDHLARFGFDAGGTTVDVYLDNVRLVEKESSSVDPVNRSVICETFELYQNYPNPFNLTTTIGYHLDVSGRVIIKVFDLNGREITTLVDMEKPFGNHEVVFNGSDLSSGVYLYKIYIGARVITRKLMLLK